MYDFSPSRKVSLQMTTNGNCKFIRYFLTEKEWFISLVLVYLCVHRLLFGINKKILYRSCTEIRINPKLLEGGILKCNIENSSFGQTKISYLGF